MTRDDAVAHIMALSSQVAGEFCCSRAKEDDLRSVTMDALRALGAQV